MEEQPIIITCPHCGFNRPVLRSMIPEGSVSVTCPKCRMGFPFPATDPSHASLPNPDAAVPMEETVPPAPTHLDDASPTSGSGTASLRAEASIRPKGSRTLSFSFHGKGGEYFGIWIVNTLLKIVTIGIYSAWAKVRKRRYFYGSTMLGDEPFEYLADPMDIFKGWVIGAVAFVLYMIGNQVSPTLSMVTGLAIFIAVPWLVVRSRMFNARNSSHRNIRFSFRPDYNDAYLVFLGFPLLIPFTLGLLIPYVIYRQKKYLVENGSYGMTPFAFDATLKSFYLLFVRATLGMVGLIVILSVLFYLVIGGHGAFPGALKVANPKNLKLLSLLPLFSSLLIYFYFLTYVQTALANLTWNGTTIGDCRFRSTLRTRDMVCLYLSNAVAIACSFGLLIPWATVRMARYRFQRLEMETGKELEGFFALARNEEVNATGEEIGDIFGVDVDFGF
jgi:uncharacterized membrane protein YjgN (DUF898 family)